MLSDEKRDRCQTVPVTRPVLPPLEEFVSHLDGIWERAQLTNSGPLVRELEQRLASFLDVPHVVIVSNGTIAIQFALRALGVKGDVLTTPFSFVATTSAIVWEGGVPKFVDIEPDTLTVDPAAVDRAATGDTRAIVATHVYGNACDVEALEAVARQRRIPLIYDAAHAFGAQYRGHSLAAFGDASALSFHATKLFHTVEGGAVVTRSAAVAERVRRMRSFGHDDTGFCDTLGINGKMSELHAAMGLCLLPRVPALIAERATLVKEYDRLLGDVESITRPRIRSGTELNHLYYPVLLASDAVVQNVVKALSDDGISARRYFFPSLNTLPYVGHEAATPVAMQAAQRVLCLPLFSGLSGSTVERVASIVRAAISG